MPENANLESGEKQWSEELDEQERGRRELLISRVDELLHTDMNQTEFAKELSLSTTSVCQLECGKYQQYNRFRFAGIPVGKEYRNINLPPPIENKSSTGGSCK